MSQDTFYSTTSACSGLVSIDITAEDICDGRSTNLVTRVIIDGEEAGVGTGSMTCLMHTCEILIGPSSNMRSLKMSGKPRLRVVIKCFSPLSL